MPTVKGIVVTALSTVTTLGLVSLLAAVGTPEAFATTPSWKTTASYAPLPNVRAVSCAAGTATCVAVGDDGGNYASILVSNNGGSTWSAGTVPNGVTALSTVSCPSPTICYAGGGTGILKSTDGGSTVGQAIAVLSHAVDLMLHDRSMHRRRRISNRWHDRWNHLESAITANWTGLPVKRLLLQTQVTCVAVGVVASNPAIIGTRKRRINWALLDSANCHIAFLLSLCATATNCVAVRTCRSGGDTHDFEHDRLHDLGINDLHPVRRHFGGSRIAQPAHVHCGGYEPRLHSVCNSDQQMTEPLDDSDYPHRTPSISPVSPARPCLTASPSVTAATPVPAPPS